jgi:outer membrane protein OmpA-like peptidoglycan-associated protein
MDLYIVRRADGAWDVPVNLGDAINSKGNEVFPYLHPEGYLFFSSDGHEGNGGLDLFVTAADSGHLYRDMQHLDAPFNSSRDDLGMIVSADGTSGYVASDRKPTKGKDDLYRWTSPKSIFCLPLKGPRGNLFEKQIMVINEQGQSLSGSYVWLIPMNQEGPTLYKDHFTTTLVPKADKEGAFYLQWSMTDTLTTSTADGVTDPGGKTVLNADLKATYVVVARQEGYLPYTEVLSGDQIPSSIVLKKMAGDDASCLQTLFSVYNASGDIELNGAKIQLSGPCLKEAMVFYTDELGAAKRCLPKGCALKAEIMQEGYAQHAFTFTPDEADEHWKIYLQNSGTLTAPVSPIASGTVIVLDNIYYDFNQSVIRKGESGELIALADILKQYPDLTIELTSHTDTRGTVEYNMELSARRSESSKSYLVLLGVDASRILTKAAGESAPRNRCVDGVPCTNAEHQYNRRTEVRIINPAQGMQIKYKAEK